MFRQQLMVKGRHCKNIPRSGRRILPCLSLTSSNVFLFFIRLTHRRYGHELAGNWRRCLDQLHRCRLMFYSLALEKKNRLPDQKKKKKKSSWNIPNVPGSMCTAACDYLASAICHGSVAVTLVLLPELEFWCNVSYKSALWTARWPANLSGSSAWGGLEDLNVPYGLYLMSH